MTRLLEITDLFGSAISPWHIVIVLAVIVLFFGGAKIPELMKGVGKGMSEFKKGVEEGKSDDDDKSKPA